MYRVVRDQSLALVDHLRDRLVVLRQGVETTVTIM